MNFPEDSFCDASWTLTYEDVDDSGTPPADRNGDFTTTSGRDIEIFNRTSDVLPVGSNTNAGSWDSDCVQPDYSATLTIEFDGQCELDSVAFDLSDDPHGGDLPYEPYIKVYNSGKGQDGTEIRPGDVRMLTVPADWTWPQERTPIWEVYGDESSGTVTYDSTIEEPVFDVEWYNGTADSTLLSTCYASTGTTN